MKQSTVVIPAVLVFVIFSCTNQPKKENRIDEEKYASYLEKGNNISNQAQAVLLGNVSNAMQKGGPEYAVEFCNLQASTLVDSLNRVNNCFISRVSEKNRNPRNKLSGKQEKQLWKYMANQSEKGNLHDTLIQTNSKLVYYKPIKTAMPACLNCHGNPGEDIQPAVLEKINTYYPDDKATGYELNDFRGMWKITFLNQ